MVEENIIKVGDLVISKSNLGYRPLRICLSLIIKKSRESISFGGKLNRWWTTLTEEGKVEEVYEDYVEKISVAKKFEFLDPVNKAEINGIFEK